MPACLAIAGSDSGGGAGIQADLKAFARCGVHGMTAITALTAQNTVGVQMVLPVAPEMIVAQVEAVASDIGVDAVKIGMLADEVTIDAVVDALDLVDEAPIVVDPVMVAESGATLLDPNAKAALIERILPRASVVTPNLPEARALSGLGASATPAGARGGGARAGRGSGGRHRRALRRRGRPARRSGRLGADRGPALSRRRLARLRVHPLLGAGRLPGPRRRSCADAARWAKEIAAEAVGNGLREIGRGAGPGRRLRARRRGGTLGE